MRVELKLLAVMLTFAALSYRVLAADETTLRHQGRIPADFSLPRAMKSLYGNFDPVSGVSTASVAADSARSSFFALEDKILVRPFSVSGVKDLNSTKVFVLTYAVPDSKSFNCHLCAPLIDAAAFVRAKNEWSLESVGKGVVVFGQWGSPPDVRVVRIGPRHQGIELTSTYSGQGEITTWASILVPWKGDIREALNTEIGGAYDDCHDVGTAPCYRHQRKIKFVKGTNPEYDDVVLTRSGTTLTKEAPYKAIDASEVQCGHFFDGKYVLIPS